MTDPSQMTVCLVDNGLYIPIAQRLARDFKRVLYFSEWVESFPKVNKRIIGDGYDEIERIDDLWHEKSEIDLFMFPDIYRSGLQLELEAQGKLVWGSRTGDRLETQRSRFLDVLQKVGLPVPQCEKIQGMMDLRRYLWDREDVYIKISKYRGSLETTHWRSWSQDEGLLDSLAVRFGPLKDLMRFLVFDALNTELELGADTYCIDGKFPKRMLNGLEAKDKGYLGSVMEREDMPDQLKQVLDKFGPVLGNERYRNAFSAEVRVVDEVGYFIDPCCRFPVPGTGAQLELIENFSEIIVAGAQGELVEPEYSSDYAAECVLTAKSEKHTWGIVDFSKEVLPFVKCGDSCRIDGRTCFPPDDSHGDEIGWIYATGNSIEETVETMKARVKLLPDGVHACTDALFDLLKEAEEAEDQGIEMSEQSLPKPEIAIET